MKTRLPNSTSARAVFALAMILAADKVLAQNEISSGVGKIQSVFTLPSSPKEGRDPFFPESVRTIGTPPVATHEVEITSLRVPGISGTPGHLFAIINNHTFTVGDEGEVLTPNGRVSLRCLDIQPDYVLVEVNGQRHRINLDSQ